MKIRTIVCFLAIALAAFYVAASMQLETRSIRKAFRSPSSGEIQPGSDQESSIVDGCIRYLGPTDVLAVLYSEPNPTPAVSPLFILYRLAYRTYPSQIETSTIVGEDIPAALAHLPRKPGWVLLLGHPAGVPGYAEISRFTPNDVLLRAAGEPR